MCTVKEILARKGSCLLSIEPTATVLQAAAVMNQHKVGAVVVLTERGIVGMFTERDVLTRVVAEQRDPAHTPVSDVMTCEVVCCKPETSLDEARGAMKTRRIRHLPVMDSCGRILGLVSIGDLNAYHAIDQEQTIYLLDEYLHGRV